jgi:hypothetical protein
MSITARRAAFISSRRQAPRWVGLDEPFPLAAAPQELPVEGPKMFSPHLGPLLVQRIGKQVAGIRRCHLRTGEWVGDSQRGLRRGLEAVDIGLHLMRREEGDQATTQHDGIQFSHRLPGVVGRHSQNPAPPHGFHAATGPR